MRSRSTSPHLSSAAAKAGRSVLQLDPATHYGGAWASHHLSEFRALLRGARPDGEQQPASGGAGASSSTAVGDARAAGLGAAAIYEASGAELGPSHEYNIDLAPKAWEWC